MTNVTLPMVSFAISDNALCEEVGFEHAHERRLVGALHGDYACKEVVVCSRNRRDAERSEDLLPALKGGVVSPQRRATTAELTPAVVTE